MEVRTVNGKKNGYIKKLIINFLISNILGWVVYVMGSFADSIVGGSALGEEALSAIGIVTPIVSVIYFVSYLVAAGAYIAHAAAIGKNDFEKADRIFSTGFYASLVIGVLMALILWIIKEPLMNMYGLEGDIRTYAMEYYTPFIFFGLISPIGCYLYNCACGDGAVYLIVAADTADAVVNLILSIILVKVIGISGLGISTLIGSVLCYAIPSINFFTKKNTCRLRFKFAFEDLWSSIKLGTSTFAAYLSAAVIDIVMNYYICVTFGEAWVAPYALVNFALQVASALSLVGSGMSLVMTISAGENIHVDIVENRKYSMKLLIFVSLGFSAVFMGLTPVWPSLFGLTSPEFIKATTFASLVIGASFLPTAFLYLISCYYTSFEKVLIPTLCNVLYSFATPLVLPVVLSLLFGLSKDTLTSYYGFELGFALTGLVSAGLMSLIVMKMNKGKLFALPESNKKEYAIDFVLNEESISPVAIELENVLKENGIDSSIINKTEVMIEEALVIINNHNKDRNKKVLGRLVVQLSPEEITIYEKDTGKIFNLTDQDQKVKDLSNYVFTALSSRATKSINYLSVSTNANHFEIPL